MIDFILPVFDRIYQYLIGQSNKNKYDKEDMSNVSKVFRINSGSVQQNLKFTSVHKKHLENIICKIIHARNILCTYGENSSTIPHGYKQSNVCRGSHTFSPYLRFCIKLTSYKNIQVKINLDMKKKKKT